MLILSRRQNESIIITNNAGKPITEITVVKIDTNQVKIGINAPVDYKVWRKELYERILNGKENEIS